MKNKILNIVVFGPGKIGSQLINEIIRFQPFYLSQNIDIRISLIVSSSLIFIENREKKNAWDVTFLTSNKSERISNLVSYIDDNNFENTIVIDTSKNSGLPIYYPYLLQSGFDVISLNSDTIQNNYLIDEIKISADIYNKSYVSISDSLNVNDAISNVIEFISLIAKHSKSNCRIKRAI